MIGTYALSAGYDDNFYLQAQKLRALIKQDFDNAFQSLRRHRSAPPAPPPPSSSAKKPTTPSQMYLCDVFTVTCNIAGIPGLSLPCGFSTGPTSPSASNSSAPLHRRPPAPNRQPLPIQHHLAPPPPGRGKVRRGESIDRRGIGGLCVPGRGAVRREGW